MSVGSDLLRFSNRLILCADAETQRVNQLEDNLIFQWSFAEAVRNQIKRMHDSYLGWDKDRFLSRMSAGAAQITRFNPQWIVNGEDPEHVLDVWESHARPDDQDGPIILGHNFLSFDTSLWRLWRLELGRPDLFPLGPALRRRIIDTHLIARAWKEGFKAPTRFGTDEFYAWQLKVAKAHRKGVKTNLAQMCKELEIAVDTTRTHEATYDIWLNVAVYWGLVNKMEI